MEKVFSKKEMTHSRRVILLGGSGFLGRSVSKYLRMKNITAISPSSSEIDLTNDASIEHLIQLFRPTDHILILARSASGVGGSFMTDMEMGVRISAALAISPCAHISYVSSVAVYPLATSFLNENSLAAPDNMYGLMHRGREMLLQEQLGDKLAIFRLSTLFGRGNPNTPYGPDKFLSEAKESGTISLWGQGIEMRDYLHVDAAAAMIADALLSNRTGLFNVVSGSSYSFQELAKSIVDVTKNNISISRKPQKEPLPHRHFDITKLLSTRIYHNELSIHDYIATEVNYATL